LRPPAARSGSVRAHGTTTRARARTTATAVAPAPSSLHVRRIDPAARDKLVAQIREAEQRAARDTAAAPADLGAPSHTATARPALADAPDLDKQYVQSAVRELAPLLLQCYETALDAHPGLAGKLVVEFTIEGEPGVGGVVGDSTVDAAASTIADPAMQECVTQTMYALEIDPPANGGTVNVTYPFTFAPAP
jgi:hypothetical protein